MIIKKALISLLSLFLKLSIRSRRFSVSFDIPSCCIVEVYSNLIIVFSTVPNEEPKSPVFTTFPQSATVSEGESVTFTCKTETAPLKGEYKEDQHPN